MYTYWKVIVAMHGKSDKFDLRLKMVQYALERGIKPAARAFVTTPPTVRKWLRRYSQAGLAGLAELSRAPRRRPHKIPRQLEDRIVTLRNAFPFMGARRLVLYHGLSCSHHAVGRVLRQNGLVYKRRKKHRRKRDLAEVKKRWRLFEQISVDTKALRDIPHYWPQMKGLSLPCFQFTAREVRSGLMFLGYAREDTAVNACLFARVLCAHLAGSGADLAGLRFQTDNGHEFVGCFRQDRTRDGFEKTVSSFGAYHKRIPPRAWSYNSDVETVHRTIEDEFFDLESFRNIRDFQRRVSTYQAWYNCLRPNMNKDNLSPRQIIQNLRPDLKPSLFTLPAIMLDSLAPDYLSLDTLSLRGYDVPWHP